jgi:3-(3-hydroxy-phenyl)propionate hydroxylase
MAEKIDVIIIGGGPTGLLLANLLGQKGIATLLVESQHTVYPIPRATHIDEETIRNFQLTGLWPILEKYTTAFGFANIVNEHDKIIFTENMVDEASVHHFTGSRFFDQPSLENVLWQGLKRFACVQSLCGYEAIEITQNENDVCVIAENKLTKEIHKYTASYLVGGDGGKSFVREKMNISMAALEPARDWIIVDTILKNEKDAALLPQQFRYILKNERLQIFAYGFGNNRRWEFQLNKGEATLSDDLVKNWVYDYIAADKIEITRIAKYAHHSLVANNWMLQKVLLAGDAAHMMPPSAGQGLCSGIRDAVNLAWKLDAVIKKISPHLLLNTYEQERKPHLIKILKRTLFISNRLNADNAFQKKWRTISLRAIEKTPALKNYLRKKYTTTVAIKEGFIYCKDKLTGTHLPQFLLSNRLYTDDIIGYQFTLICNVGLLNYTDIVALRETGIMLLQEKIDASINPFFTWLKKNDIDFALVRPDKIIFGTGKIENLNIVLNCFFSLANVLTYKNESENNSI